MMSRASINNSKKSDTLSDKIAAIRENNARLENRHREIELDRKFAIDNGNSIMPSQIKVTIYRQDAYGNRPRALKPDHNGVKLNLRKSFLQFRGSSSRKQCSTSMSKLPQHSGDCEIENYSYSSQQKPWPAQQYRRSGFRQSGAPRGRLPNGGCQNGPGQINQADDVVVRRVVISEPSAHLQKSPQQQYPPQHHPSWNSNNYNDTSNSAVSYHRSVQNGHRQDFSDLPPRPCINEARNNKNLNFTKSLSSLDTIPVDHGGYGNGRFVPNYSRDNQTNWKPPRRGGHVDGNSESYHSSHQPSYSNRQYQVPPRFRNRINQPNSLNWHQQQQQQIRIPAEEPPVSRGYCGNAELQNNSHKKASQSPSYLKVNVGGPFSQTNSSSSREPPSNAWVRGNVIRSKGVQNQNTNNASSDSQKPTVSVATISEGTSTPASPKRKTGPIAASDLTNEVDFLVFDDEYIDDNPLDDLDQYTLKIDMEGGFVVHDASINHPMLSKPIRSWIDDDDDCNYFPLDDAGNEEVQKQPHHLPTTECSLSSSGVSTLSSRRMSTGDILACRSYSSPPLSQRQTVSLDCLHKLLYSNTDLDSGVKPGKMLFGLTNLEAGYFQLAWE